MKMYRVSMWLAKDGKSSGSPEDIFTIPANDPKTAADISLSYQMFSPKTENNKYYNGWNISVDLYRGTMRSTESRYFANYTDSEVTPI